MPIADTGLSAVAYRTEDIGVKKKIGENGSVDTLRDWNSPDPMGKYQPRGGFLLSDACRGPA